MPARVRNSTESCEAVAPGVRKFTVPASGSAGGVRRLYDGMSGLAGGFSCRVAACVARSWSSVSVSSKRMFVISAWSDAIRIRCSSADDWRAAVVSSRASCPRFRLLVSADRDTSPIVKIAT